MATKDSAMFCMHNSVLSDNRVFEWCLSRISVSKCMPTKVYHWSKMHDLLLTPLQM